MKATARSRVGGGMRPHIARATRRPGPVSVSGPFVCRWSAVGDCAVVRVAGQVDSATAPTFENELRRVITTKLPTLVVDLRRVTSMNAAGIDALATGHALAVELGGWMRLSGAKKWLTDLIQANRLDLRLQHYPTLAEALPRYRPAVAGPPRMH
jgi:anti-anti-sigma factor